jgi:hypothetical protein
MSSKPAEEARSVRGLIDLQRRLMQSRSPFNRCIGPGINPFSALLASVKEHLQ